jgi:hypothetical protein
MTLPFERSYWVIPGLFLAGHFPGDKRPDVAETKIRNLVACGVRRIINLMEETEVDHDGDPFTDYQSVFHRLTGTAGATVRYPIRDLDVPPRPLLSAILDDIDASVARGEPVYVHCWGGVGRTGTTVGAHLIRHGRAAGETVLEVVAELRRNDPKAFRQSPETAAQRALVQSWRRGE